MGSIENSIKSNETRENIKRQFTYYLSNIARSARRTSDGYNLQSTAVQSFLGFLETDKLFDYAPEKWQHIKSMYDITVPEQVDEIANNLLEDAEFQEHDNKKNQGWRSGSIIHYACFIKARAYFMNEKSLENHTSASQKDSVTTQKGHISFRPYITAIKSKPFLLLAGISGTGKSRIVRELARACWEEGTDEYKAQKPKNFQMVQVKPNWHDSSDLIGYVSRVSGKAEFVAGEFLKFIAKAWEDVETPYFLCLDEMNLAPVEQYFAEYLSVIETRKSHEEDTVTTDPILEKSAEDWYKVLTSELTNEDNVRNRFLEEGICIPQNLIVVGTVNMDETTFSFSRKVLDRAMTIEMNEVDLYGGLTKHHESIGKLDNAELVGSAVEGVDIYNDNTDVCDIALRYLQKINDALEGTPFKIAYRTRNEFLLYVVNNLPYCKDENGNDLEQGYVIARALDEITSMKILSRIEGDDTKVSDNFLDSLSKTVEEGLKAVSGEENAVKSISLAKLKEMKDKLVSGYTSFWS